MSETENKTTGKKSADAAVNDPVGADAAASKKADAAASIKTDAVRMLQLMWAPPAPPSRGPKPKITLDQIVEAAVRVADEQGQEALSMRRVASELTMGTMSLYTYVASKVELLELMVDKVFGERRPSDPGAPWRERARALAVDRWGILRRHPWVLDQSLFRFSWGPNAMEADEEIYAVLDSAGLSPRQVVESAAAIHAYVHGAAHNAQLEHGAEQASGTSLLEHHVARSVFYETFYEEGRFPATNKLYLTGGFDEFSLDPFLFGLERLLDGIEALLR